MNDNILIDAIEIIKKLIENSPTIARECGGDLSCFFCYHDQNQRTDIHDKDCIYLKATEFIKKSERLRLLEYNISRREYPSENTYQLIYQIKKENE